jgi:flagellar biosynthesis chaperone FliJ
MILKSLKYGVITVAAVAIVGGVVFGKDLYSYVSSGSKILRTSVKDNVPIEFELARARDLVNDIVPEMQANVRLVAQQEVEIAALREEITNAHASLDTERAKLTKLRRCLDTQDVSFTLGGATYSRDQVKTELVRKLDLVREAEVVLSGKDRLLDNRQKSLAAAMQVLERTRSQKALLEGQIASLESQHRLIQAASVGSGSRIDTSKLAQTQKLIADIKKQLDVSERVLAHQSRFVEPMVIDVVDEKDVTRQADEYLAERNGDGELERAETASRE